MYPAGSVRLGRPWRNRGVLGRDERLRELRDETSEIG